MSGGLLGRLGDLFDADSRDADRLRADVRLGRIQAQPGGILASSVFSLIIYYVAMAKRLPSAQVDHYVREVYPPPVGE